MYLIWTRISSPAEFILYSIEASTLRSRQSWKFDDGRSDEIGNPLSDDQKNKANIYVWENPSNSVNNVRITKQ